MRIDALGVGSASYYRSIYNVPRSLSDTDVVHFFQIYDEALQMASSRAWELLSSGIRLDTLMIARKLRTHIASLLSAPFDSVKIRQYLMWECQAIMESEEQRARHGAILGARVIAIVDQAACIVEPNSPYTSPEEQRRATEINTEIQGPLLPRSAA